MRDDVDLIKCLVWDLDNTLWRGTLLEDDEVRLPRAVRDLIVTLDSRGVLQSVASKNDHDLAFAKLEELGVAEYFVLPKIGWGPKSVSVGEIADQLRFAHGVVGFVDDQPAERAEVSFHLPEVRCYAAEELARLAELPEFNPTTVTVDARRRREMYQAGFEREVAQSSHTGPAEEFLRSLDLRMLIERATEEQLSRVEELTRRTSQMNATGVHCSGEMLRSLLADPDHEVLVASMTDRFGPHGAVGVLLVARYPGLWHLKLLATSCRVVSFGAGATIINWLVDQAAGVGAHLAADFRPTDRNRMMEIAYRFAGFNEDGCACLSVLPETDTDGVGRLHLIAERRPPHPTTSLVAPDLAASRVGGAAEPGGFRAACGPT